MRTKEDVEQEFEQVKANLVQAEQVCVNCRTRISELQGQFQLLELQSKEQVEKKK